MLPTKTNQLKRLISPIEDHLDRFKKYFDDILDSNVSLLNLILKYLKMKHGKMIRPSLVFLSAGLLGKINERSYKGAALVELLHTATLIHDDVVDEAEERRGLASINAKWNNKIAVLVGDYLLSQGLIVAVDAKEYDFLDTTSNAVKRMSKGELMSIKKSIDLEINENEYFKIISDKTAALLSACSHIGAISITEDKDTQQKLLQYGENLGMAFQIQDDILDYTSNNILLGKPVGNDLKEKKITLPLIYALQSISENEALKIAKKIKKGKLKKNEIREIIEFTKEKHGIEKAKEKAFDFSSKARENIEGFEDNVFKSSLLELTNFVVERAK